LFFCKEERSGCGTVYAVGPLPSPGGPGSSSKPLWISVFANIDNELDAAISGLKKWWVLKENDCFTFALETRIELR
jgi:hypothetical protein